MLCSVPHCYSTSAGESRASREKRTKGVVLISLVQPGNRAPEIPFKEKILDPLLTSLFICRMGVQEP